VLEGARQIRAKARVVAKFTRPEQRTIADGDQWIFDSDGLDPKWHTIISTEKYKRGAAGKRYAVGFKTEKAVDPYTGREDVEFDAAGNPQSVMLYVVDNHWEMEPEKVAATPAPPRADLEAKIRTLLANDPKMTVRAVIKEVGCRSSDACAIVRKVRGTL
jgi:hypothetical protein